MSDEESGADWRRYPFQLIAGDSELAFPAAEGDQGAESNTYYVSGQLRGRVLDRTQIRLGSKLVGLAVRP